MPAGKSKGKLKGAFPLLSVVKFGIRPAARGLLDAWLVTHCESVLKYQCTVKVVLGVLLSVPFTMNAVDAKGTTAPSFTALTPSVTISGRAVGVTDVSSGKFC